MTEFATITDPLPSWPRRGATIDQVVLHESVTSSREATVAVLRARGLSVHLIVDRDGSVTQHAPLADQCAHAGRLNGRSIGVEVVNRYYGVSAASTLAPTIRAVWAHRGLYTLPTSTQCEAVYQVVVDLHERIATIPLTFPGVSAACFWWGRLPLWQRFRVPAGVLAHHRDAHADGLFPEHYCLARSLGHEPVEAYRLTTEAASSGLRRTALSLSGGVG